MTLTTDSALDGGTRLQGWAGDAHYFTIRERDTFDPESVIDVLEGRSVGVMFRGIVPPVTCTALANAFWASSARRRRGVEAPGHYLGAYHYHKTIGDYLDETEACAPALASVLGVDGEPSAVVRRLLGEALERRGVTFRLAEHRGRQACRALLRSWDGQGEFALAPHEDFSQCREPRQAGFEIQQATDFEVVALNICIENGTGGRLAVWNIKPSEEEKRRHGLHYTGSPYPLSVLDGIEVAWTDVRAGDVYFLNGAHVHAVEPNTDARQRRTTLAALMGFVNERMVVSWT